MKITELLAKKAELVARRNAVLQAIKDNDFEASDEQIAERDALAAKIKNVEGMIAEAEAEASRQADAAQMTLGRQGPGEEDAQPAANSTMRVEDVARLLPQLVTRRPRNAAEVRCNPNQAPFASFGDYLKAVTAKGRGTATAEQMNRLTGIGAYNGNNETVDSDGGFAVPSDFNTYLMDDSIASGTLARRCANLTTSMPSVSLPKVKENSRADGSRHGGVQAYWTNEADEITKSKLQFEKHHVSVDKLSVLVPVTEEMQMDAPLYASWVNLHATNAMGFKIDDAIVRGSGNGQPLGILNAPCLVTVAKESGQSAATVVYPNLTKMMPRMRPGSKSRMVWLANQEVYGQVLNLQDNAGRNIFLQGQNVANLPVDRLIGREYVEQEQCSALGDVGDLIAADLSRYLIINRSGLQTDFSPHVYFVYAENAMRMMMRLGGQPMDAAPLTPYKGNAANTLSAFVTLAARA